MENEAVNVRTLGEYLDSGEEIVGARFESRVAITNHSDKVYSVHARPEGEEKHFQVIPLGDRDGLQLDGSRNREPVRILLWQHRDDKEVR